MGFPPKDHMGRDVEDVLGIDAGQSGPTDQAGDLTAELMAELAGTALQADGIRQSGITKVSNSYEKLRDRLRKYLPLGKTGLGPVDVEISRKPLTAIPASGVAKDVSQETVLRYATLTPKDFETLFAELPKKGQERLLDNAGVKTSEELRAYYTRIVGSYLVVSDIAPKSRPTGHETVFIPAPEYKGLLEEQARAKAYKDIFEKMPRNIRRGFYNAAAEAVKALRDSWRGKK